MRTKKQIAILLVIALIITTVPNIFDATIATAKEAWKILSEQDLVIDEVYNINDDVMIGRKDGKISFLDNNLQLINQTEYDQIEESLGREWLVSRLVDEKSEFAILDQTGEVKKVLGIYDMVFTPYAMNEEGYFLFARKENGQYGFLIDEKEIGFDDVFVGEEGMIRAEILTVGEKDYYVKEYFQDEEVWENICGIGSLWYDEGISVKEFQEILAMENCEFIFYDEKGTVIPGDAVAESIKTQKEQEKIQEQETEKKKEEIKEEAKQLPIAEYGTATWESYGEYYGDYFSIETISVSQFGKGYLAYMPVEINDIDGFTDTVYFAGVYDSDGKLQRFGELLATDEADEIEYEYESVVLRGMDKKIYFYHLGTEKYIYTDEKNEYSSYMYDENRTYEEEVILWGDDNVLVANPQSGFLKIAETYYYFYDGKVRNVLLMGTTADSKELVFYDSQWNEIKKVDLSGLEDDFRYRKYDDGVAVYDEKRYIYIDAYGGNDYQISLSDYPEFADVEDIYTVKGYVYAYLESEKGHMLYRLENMDKMKVADNIEIWMPVIIEGQGFWQYRIMTENDQHYYGLMDFQGNLVVDAMEMGYIKGYTRTRDEDNMCAIFEDEEGNEFYYYEKTLTAHSDDDDWDNSGNNGTRYDDIVYYSNSLYDEEKEEFLGKEEKVYDNDGNLLVGHIVPEELLADSGWKEYIYIYQMSKTILAINKYWDGKRGGDWSTFEPLATLTPTPTPTDIEPTKTAAPSEVKPTKTAAPGGVKPERTVPPVGVKLEKTAAPSGIEPEETVGPSGTEPEESVAPSDIGKGKIKRIKNRKGKKVRLSLKKVEDARGYQIAYATNKKFRKKKLLTSKKLTVTVRRLKKKKTYYFKVRAYYSMNGKKKYGKWSNVKKIKIRR